MISLKQREHANGYLDALTPNEMLERGAELFRRRHVEVITADSNRKQIRRFDARAIGEEEMAADRRAELVKRLTDAEARRVEAETAIKNYILEAAELIKAERGDCIRCEQRQADLAADAEVVHAR